MKLLSLVLGLFMVAPAFAGQTCLEIPPDAEQVVQATQMAELVLTQLNELTDEVVLISRVGQDLTKYGLKYSHMAFAVKQETGWGVVHELNKCGTAESALYDQGLVDFFSDKPVRYQAGIWRLQPHVQSRIKRALAGKPAARMHGGQYSMLAYPFNTQYQNSNGWLLEVLAYSLAPADEVETRSDAQGWLRKSGYVPTKLAISMLTRLGARITRANIAFDDHPPQLRWAGEIETVTVSSIINFLGILPAACAVEHCPEIEVVLP